MEAYHNPIMYMIEKRYESTFNKLESIQQFIVSLVDRILKVVADINLRLKYVMELCLRLVEDPIHPDRSKTPMPQDKDK